MWSLISDTAFIRVEYLYFYKSIRNMPPPSTTVVLLQLKKGAHTHTIHVLLMVFFFHKICETTLDTTLISTKGMCRKGGISFFPDAQMSNHLGLYPRSFVYTLTGWFSDGTQSTELRSVHFLQLTLIFQPH